MDLSVLLDLAIIFFFAEIFGLIAKRLMMPQVVGQIIAGLLIGPSILGWVSSSDLLEILAECGVILLMFMAGLSTDLKELIRSGLKSLVVASIGVAVPLVMGYILYSAFYGFAPVGDDGFFAALFTGVIMTATSVSITVTVLKELGKLNSEAGTVILGAAIIDDVIGMVVLTVVSGMRSPDKSPLQVLGSTALFFVVSIAVGFIIYRIFKLIDKRFNKSRLISVFAIALCFIMAYVAEKFFGISDITGAYVAGIILCNLSDASFIEGEIDTESYLFFGPIFFASIGIKTDIRGMDLSLLLFTLIFILVALVSKIIGCGGAARILGFSGIDSLRIGVGMMSRGEVGLIVAQKALALGCLTSNFFTAVILMIVVSSIVTPVALKALYRDSGGKRSSTV